MPNIYYKKNGNNFYKVVEDGENSATFKIVATETSFGGVSITTEEIGGFDGMTETEWNELVDSYKDALNYCEFIGGHPPHFPIPTRPK